MARSTSTATSTAQSGGIGGLTLLGIVFITLKLTDVIAWSWWWVLVPFWGPVALFFGGLAVVGLVAVVVVAVDR